MRTIAACVLTALLACVVTATAANRGEPVHDAQAVKQLKLQVTELREQGKTLDNIAGNTYWMCYMQEGVQPRSGCERP